MILYAYSCGLHITRSPAWFTIWAMPGTAWRGFSLSLSSEPYQSNLTIWTRKREILCSFIRWRRDGHMRPSLIRTQAWDWTREQWREGKGEFRWIACLPNRRPNGLRAALKG